MPRRKGAGPWQSLCRWSGLTATIVLLSLLVGSYWRWVIVPIPPRCVVELRKAGVVVEVVPRAVVDDEVWREHLVLSIRNPSWETVWLPQILRMPWGRSPSTIGLICTSVFMPLWLPLL